MKQYQVIGGQYRQRWHGESNSLHGARIIAGMNKEYWDNWQGWHTPRIYKAEDCYKAPDGRVFHQYYAEPV